MCGLGQTSAALLPVRIMFSLLAWTVSNGIIKCDKHKHSIILPSGASKKAKIQTEGIKDVHLKIDMIYGDIPIYNIWYYNNSKGFNKLFFFLF